MFDGTKFLSICNLGVSQIYLNEDKLMNISKWMDPNDLSNFEPLPVYDFGNGKLTLTDGHSRAFLAYTMGVSEVPCVCDTDDIVVSGIGQMLYKNDIVWCERFKICSVMDLKDRIVSSGMYKELWVDRCDKAYNLLTKTTELQRDGMQSMCPDLYLYGANEDLTLLFLENEKGKSFSVPNTKESRNRL